MEIHSFDGAVLAQEADAEENLTAWAIAELATAHRRRLQSFIFRHIGHWDDAVDLTQQTLLKATEMSPGFRGTSTVSTWVHGIALNLARNYLKRTPHRRYSFESIASIEEHAAPDADPSDLLERSQRVQALFGAFESLSKNMQDALWLVAIDELSYEQTSALLEVPIGTVRSRVSRARTSLRARMKAIGLETLS